VAAGLPLEGIRGSETRRRAFRRDVPTLDRAVERMRRQNLTTPPVTTADGRLLGLLERDTAERALRELNLNSSRTL
jgi:hypothetical protein